MADRARQQEEELLKYMSSTIARHPSVVNASSAGESKESLLQFVVRHCNFPSVRSVTCADWHALAATQGDASLCTGLQPDATGQTALDTALQVGKWQAIHALLNAYIDGRFAIVPEGMASVTSIFYELAHKFPRDFLRFIKNLPLQPEPEVLGGMATHDVMLPSSIVLGSSSRCPKGIWRNICEQHKSTIGGDEQKAALAALNRRVSEWTRGEPLEVFAKEGFCKATQGSIEAFRVPFENFAANIDTGLGGQVSPLKLIVEAAVKTQDFTVFGSRPVELLLEYKWKAFARFSIVVETALFCVHVTIAAVYNLAVADNMGTPTAVLLGIEPGSTPNYLLILGWIWTTIYSIVKGVAEMKQFRASGFDLCDYITDMSNLLDQTIVVGQIFINVCFWFVDERIDLFFKHFVWFPEVNNSRRLNEVHGGHAYASTVQGGWATGPQSHAPDGAARMLATSANTVTATWETVGGFQVIEAVVIVALFTRLIFYFRGSLKFGALVYLLFEVRAFVCNTHTTLTLVIATECFAFVVRQVFADISAFVVLLLISFLTFAFSMRILVSSTSNNDNRVAGFPSLESAIFSAVNMGLYAQVRWVKISPHPCSHSR
eukprot:5420398-Prymnesium_polylepis.1